ncbi:hypothetical protein DFA_08380 [Cavenderia fasciculata]|uniref:Uncharacterized protein n=1 Tax=Cavenderia fasciculata TaxID=261658 RepID=F4Q5X6_CACFS|nr:uncharacterized protein DFA_08380 [Cavenderia fasciculata]EGG17385.1 hypothetical protein DFA_08380 [Cavenderia fasciculata]|eukprot:XP_004355869.1 hypothetical protein DFA_08380 [Cavenderia fasciculata]
MDLNINTQGEHINIFKRNRRGRGRGDGDDATDDAEIKEFWREDRVNLTLAASLPHTTQALIVYYSNDIKLDLVCWRFFRYVSQWCTHVYRPYCSLSPDSDTCLDVFDHLISPYCPLKTITHVGISTENFFLNPILEYATDIDQKYNKETETTFKPCDCLDIDTTTTTYDVHQKIQTLNNYHTIANNVLESIEYLAGVATSYHEDDEDYIVIMLHLPNLRSFIYNALDNEFEDKTLTFLSNNNNTDDDDDSPDDDDDEDKDEDRGIPVSLEEICLYGSCDELFIKDWCPKIIKRHEQTIQHFSCFMDYFDNEEKFASIWKPFLETIRSFNLPNAQDMVYKFHRGPETSLMNEEFVPNKHFYNKKEASNYSSSPSPIFSLYVIGYPKTTGIPFE